MQGTKKLAEDLKSARAEKGWSTAKLAQIVNENLVKNGATTSITQQAVSGFEQGNHRREPSWFRVAMAALMSDAPGETLRSISIDLHGGSFERLNHLRVETESTSYSEVVKRALRVYELVVDANRHGGATYVELDGVRREIILV